MTQAHEVCCGLVWGCGYPGEGSEARARCSFGCGCRLLLNAGRRDVLLYEGGRVGLLAALVSESRIHAERVRPARCAARVNDSCSFGCSRSSSLAVLFGRSFVMGEKIA